MFFTQDDYKKIQQWLIKNSVKDTEFNEANIPFNGNEIVSIVQGSQNKKILLKDLVSQIFNLGVSDFVNITDKYNAPNINLEEAVSLIPLRARKEGQVITFLDEENHWYIYQFKGTLNQWNILEQWKDLFESIYINSILPDEEDLTKSLPDENGNSYLSFKNKRYNKLDFSGLGKVYLRKNIINGVNTLLQKDINGANTIYIIQYDYDLNGKSVTVPTGCMLDFQGGSLRNGTLILNGTVIQSNNCCFGDDLILDGEVANGLIEFSWFSNNGASFQRVTSFSVTKYVKIDRTIPCDDTVTISKTIGILGCGNTVPSFLFTDGTKIGVHISKANLTEIKSVYIRGARVGLYVDAHSCLIEDCKLSYNSIGLLLKDSYITRVVHTHVTFNKIGLFAKGMSYETVVTHNVIDNNLGGIGVVVNGTCAPVLRYNTIEGNRVAGNSGSQFGVGVILAGYHLSTKIIDNWFELNGDTSDSVNVFAYQKTFGVAYSEYDSIKSKIETIVSKYEDIGALTTLTKGTFELSNVHVFTAKSYMLAGYRAKYFIHNNKYNGSSVFDSKPIEIYARPTGNESIDCEYLIQSEDIIGAYKVDKGENGDGVFVYGFPKSILVDGQKNGYGEIDLKDIAQYKVDFGQRFVSSGNQVKYVSQTGYPFGDVYKYGAATKLVLATDDSFVDKYRGYVLLAIYNVHDKNVYPFTYVKSAESAGYIGNTNYNGYYNVLPALTDDVVDVYVGANTEIMALYAIPQDIYLSRWSFKYVKFLYEDNMRLISYAKSYLDGYVPDASAVDKGRIIFNYTKNRYMMSNGSEWINLDGSPIVTSDAKPNNPTVGTISFHSGKPTWWNGSVWVDATGTTV